MTRSQCLIRVGACATLALLLAAAPAPGQPSGPPPPSPPDTPAAVRDTSAAPYVIESVATRHRYEADGTGTFEQVMRVKVQSTAGLEYWGQLSFLHAPSAQSVAFPVLEVHKADGTVVKAGPSAITEAAVQPDAGVNMFQDMRQTLVTVPSLAVGDTLVARVVRTVHTPTIPGHYTIEHEFTTMGVVLDEQLEIDVPAAQSPTIRAVSTAPAEASALEGTVADGRRRFRWRTRHLVVKDAEAEVIDLTDETSEALLPDVRVSTFTDWASLAAWYRGLAAPAVVVDDTIRAKARELTAQATTDDTRIQALYEFVARDIRYVSLSFGIGRFAPHPAPEVLANRYGDCKDKHTLLAALLQAIGVEAWPVLANAGRRVDPKLPSPAEFNHLITVIPRGASRTGWLWLDTTPGTAPFGMLLPPLRDRDVLVVAPAGASPARAAALVRTPSGTSFERFVRVSTQLELDALGGLRGTIRHVSRGDIEVLLRGALRNLPSEQYPELAKHIAKTVGLGDRVSDVRVNHLETTREPLEISFSARDRGGLAWTDSGATLTIPAEAIEFLNETAEAWAKMPGIPLLGPHVDARTLRLRLPEGYRATLPVPVSVSRDELAYASSYRLDGRDVVIERTLTIKVPALRAASAPGYLSLIAAVRADEAQKITLAFDGSVLPTIPADATAGELYNAAYAMYQHRRDAQAIALGEAAVKVDPKHNGAWDLIGLSHQRQGRLAEAIEALRTQVTVRPTHDRAHAHLAGALRDAGRTAEAQVAFAKHLEVAPTDGQAFADLGQLLLEAERYADAAARLERAAALKPADAWVFARLGASYAGLDDPPKARAAFEQALRLSSEPPILAYASWRLAVEGLERTWAEELARTALTKAAARLNALKGTEAAGAAERDLVARVAWSWDALGWLRYQAGDDESAERYAAAALALKDDGAIALHLGHIRQRRPAAGAPPSAFTIAQAPAQGPTPIGRARIVLLVAADGRVLDSRFDKGDEGLRALLPLLASTSFPIHFPDDTLSRLPIELDVECPANGPCRTVVTQDAWK